MKRTTIFADETTLETLKHIAEEEGISIAEVIREAMSKFIAQRKGERKKISILGIGQSGRNDIAERCEELLWIKAQPRVKAMV